MPLVSTRGPPALGSVTSGSEYRHRGPTRTAPVADDNPSVALPDLGAGHVELCVQGRTHRLDGRVAPACAAHQGDEGPCGTGVRSDEIRGLRLGRERELGEDAGGGSLPDEEEQEVQVPGLVLDRGREPSSEAVLDG